MPRRGAKYCREEDKQREKGKKIRPDKAQAGHPFQKTNAPPGLCLMGVEPRVALFQVARQAHDRGQGAEGRGLAAQDAPPEGDGDTAGLLQRGELLRRNAALRPDEQ